MKTKKINLEELGQTLSRSEMKKVMAGSGDGTCYSQTCSDGCVAIGGGLGGQNCKEEYNSNTGCYTCQCSEPC